jgi:succinate dehydrogenase / fumarate reductase cytochrome b subunit
MRSVLENPITRKLITGVTGLGLTIFVVAHMLGNLSYFSPNPHAYNLYSHTLISLGPLLWIVELGLLGFFVFHVILGFSIWRKKGAARDVGYQVYRSVGTPSMQSTSSRSMIITGGILLIFIVIHLISFKYGPGIGEGYTVNVDGVEMRDMKRLLEEKFASPIYTFAYTGVMLLLALHLRHGIWSSLQSLGAMNARLTPIVYGIGLIMGILIAIGFFVLPLYIYTSTLIGSN